MILLQDPTVGAFSILTNYGLPGICILALGIVCWKFISNMQAKQTKLEDFVMSELKEMNENMIKVIENNTNAMKEIKEEQEELRKEFNQRSK